MKRQLIWKGLDFDSQEICDINFLPKEIIIQSTIQGHNKSADVRCDYQIKISSRWQVSSFEVSYKFNKISQRFSGLHTDAGWIINNHLKEDFKNCIDIDITLTPFTNTLPIKRLNLEVNKPQEIKVVYIDVLENMIRTADQQYTKKSETEYNFQNVPNDFEANIIVDTDGFVVHYPQLFDRIKG